MILGVADTHTAIWYLFDDKRLSGTVGEFIDQAAVAGERLYRFKGCLCATDPEHVFKECHLTVDVVEAMRRVARSDVPDMPDRIVAATAVYLNVPVISRDGRIRASSVQTIW